MAISLPSNSEPQPAKSSTVAEIDLSAIKIKREREITG
jgi:hypothetical protein